MRRANDGWWAATMRDRGMWPEGEAGPAPTARGRGMPARRQGAPAARGQALVEFAAFFTLIMMLLAGLINVGGLLDDHLNVMYAARQGARTAAVMGTQSMSDCAIVGAVQAALANVPNLQLQQIVIYRADAYGKPQGTSSETIYPGATACTISGGTASFSLSPTTNNYPPGARNNTPYTEDSVGVELDYTYTFQFPLFGGRFSAADRSVMPVSPITIPTP